MWKVVERQRGSERDKVRLINSAVLNSCFQTLWSQSSGACHFSSAKRASSYHRLCNFQLPFPAWQWQMTQWPFSLIATWGAVDSEDWSHSRYLLHTALTGLTEIVLPLLFSPCLMRNLWALVISRLQIYWFFLISLLSKNKSHDQCFILSLWLYKIFQSVNKA